MSYLLDYVNLLLPALSSTNSHKRQTVTLQLELMLYLFTFSSCLRLSLFKGIVFEPAKKSAVKVVA